MKKKDLVDLFLRNPSITVLITEVGLFTSIANQVIATVNSRYKYSNFSITYNHTLRSPYLTNQYLRFCGSSEDYISSGTEETLVVYGRNTNLETLEEFPQSCSFVRIED